MLRTGTEATNLPDGPRIIRQNQRRVPLPIARTADLLRYASAAVTPIRVCTAFGMMRQSDRRFHVPMTLRLLAAATLVAIIPSIALGATASPSNPAVVKYLKKQGLEVESRFAAPGNLTGYIAKLPDGKHVVFYVPHDGSVALFGALVDAHGHNLTRDYFGRYVQSSSNRKLYTTLAAGKWIAAGDPHPRRIVYAFVDPNCPYCRRFWQVAQTAYAHGVQVRYVMVAILGGSSVSKAAAILGAKKPLTALNQNERGFHHHSGAITPLKHVPDALRQELADNASLMAKFGLDGTPGLVWKDAHGEVRTSDGLPPYESLLRIFGMNSGTQNKGP